MYLKHYSERSSPKENTKQLSGNFVTSLELLNDGLAARSVPQIFERLQARILSKIIYPTFHKYSLHFLDDVLKFVAASYQKCSYEHGAQSLKSCILEYLGNTTVNEVSSEKQRSR